MRIDQLKDIIKSKLLFFNNGYADLYLDQTAKQFTSLTGEENIAFGIDDSHGNYFYIRKQGSLQIRKSRNQIIANVAKQEIIENMVLVANVQGADPDMLFECLLNVMFTPECTNPITINSADLTNERVLVQELNFLDNSEIKAILSRLGDRKLVRISFTITREYQPNPRDCFECKPCKNC